MSMNELHRRPNALFKEIDQILKANVEILVGWINNKEGRSRLNMSIYGMERYIQLTIVNHNS